MVVIERKVKPKLNGIRKTFRNAKVGKSNQKKKKKKNAKTHIHTKGKGDPKKTGMEEVERPNKRKEIKGILPHPL